MEPIDADDLMADLDDEELEEDSTHAAIERLVAEQGFRLPHPDEWEHAVQSERGALFRWGDDMPLDSHPVTGGPFTRHKEPGRFGLRLTDDPYRPEVTSMPSILKSGDGGSIVCAGVEAPLCWITFATAWVFDCSDLEDQNVCFESAWVRRVKSITR